MCGIFGVCYWDQTPIHNDAVIAARDKLVHRGPDDAGIYLTDQAALAHRRLSIIDLSPLGRQPMTNENGTIWITFNGEIYNYLDLRERLVARGHQFKSNTDTEVIVHAYEEWGTDCLAKLDGMFALGIWDAPRERMILARDRRGKKPLYYHYYAEKRLVFASTLRPLLNWKDVPKEIDREDIYEFIQLGYFHGSQSILKHVAKIPLGHFAVFEKSSAKIEKYYDIVEVASRPRLQFASEEACLDELEQLLRSAVRKRLMSDVPVGAFLSGGVDSSLIAALTREVSSSPIQTFTIGFNEQGFDESDYAQKVAAHLKILNKTVKMSGNEMLKYVPEITKIYDEPLVDFSLFPTMAVSELARTDVTVVLSGDGGDELFVGYDRYQAMSYFQSYFSKIPQVLRRFIANQLSKLAPNERLQRLMKLIGASDTAEFCGSYSNILRYYDLRDLLLGDQWQEKNELATDFIRSKKSFEPIEAAMLFDLTHGMVDGILVKVDRATMAFGVEARCPLIDVDVNEFALRLPWSMKSHGHEQKRLLKKLLCRYLPKELVYRKKMGFTPPMSQWLRKDLRELLTDSLSAETIERRGLFNPIGVQKVIQQHLKGELDHSYLLWEMLMLEMWMKEYIDRA